MKDQFGRDINYMRISITDRCNLRCRYCMPPEGIQKVSMSQILTYEEILRICEAAVSLGITRFKVTGGEPLVRRGCPSLIAGLKRIPGVEQVTLTTNGQRLAGDAAALRDAGLDGVNVSLDSLREDRYRDITGGGDLFQTLAGIEAALACGLKTKVNCLLQREFNEDELPDFAALAFGRGSEAEDGNDSGVTVDSEAADKSRGSEITAAIRRICGRGLDVRFIEIMPVGFGRPETGLSNADVLARLLEIYPDLVEDERTHGNGPAVYYRRSATGLATDEGSTTGGSGPAEYDRLSKAGHVTDGVRTTGGSGPAEYDRRGAAGHVTDGVRTTGGSGAADSNGEIFETNVAGGAIGLISAMHASFCGSCNRIRLTSQGDIKPCLCYEDSVSLIPALRGSESASGTVMKNHSPADDTALQEALRAAVLGKPVGHTFENRSSVEPKSMMEIGG